MEGLEGGADAEICGSPEEADGGKGEVSGEVWMIANSLQVSRRAAAAGPFTIGKLILTLTVNPAIDRTITADRLVFEDRAHILARSESAGGRGINSSLVLQRFGARTLAILPSGGDSGPRFEADLSRLGIPSEIVPIAAAVRSNLILTDRQGLTIKLNEPGPVITVEEQGRLLEAVRRHLPGASWLMLCGSLPPGVPAEFYRVLIRAAHEHGVKTLLDTDGEVLQDALLERPTVVTPNRQEAQALLNKSLITRQHYRSAAQRMLEMGAQSVVLSLGSRGAFGAREGLTVEAVPPRVDSVSPIGAGDALNAAFVWAMARGCDFADAVRWGVAAGTASACLPGIEFAGLEETRAMWERVKVM
jgi:1-phosphofructokinase family hexose kinase